VKAIQLNFNGVLRQNQLEVGIKRINNEFDRGRGTVGLFNLKDG